MDLESAIYARLTGDYRLTERLSVYRNAPAVFTESPVPDDVAFPYVVVTSVSDVPLDTLAETGRSVVRDFGCYARFTGSTQYLGQITERVRHLFHRQKVEVEGYSNFITQVIGINVAPSDRTVAGRIVSVRFSLRKL